MFETSGEIVTPAGVFPNFRVWRDSQERILDAYTPNDTFTTGVLPYQVGKPVYGADGSSCSSCGSYSNSWWTAHCHTIDTGCMPPRHGTVFYTKDSIAEIKIRDGNPGAFAIGGFMSDNSRYIFTPLSKGKYVNTDTEYDLPSPQPSNHYAMNTTSPTRPNYEGGYAGQCTPYGGQGTYPGEVIQAEGGYGVQYGTSNNARKVDHRMHTSDQGDCTWWEPIYRVWDHFSPHSGWGSLGADTQLFYGFDASGREANLYQHDPKYDFYKFWLNSAEQGAAPNLAGVNLHLRTWARDTFYRKYKKSLFH